MQGQRVGYIRVSTLDQNEERQLEGVPLDRLFIDKASGKDTQRPQLAELLKYVRGATRPWSTAWTAWPATWWTCAASSGT